MDVRQPPILMPPYHGSSLGEVGGKGYGLIELIAQGGTTPLFFIVTASAFDWAQRPLAEVYRQVREHVQSGNMEAAVEDWRNGMEGIRTSPDVEGLARCVETGFARTFRRGDVVAVRSSSVAEDGADLSFAGQFVSRLMVREDDVLDAVLECWSSSCAPGVVAYQLAHGRSSLPRMAIIIQKMVQSNKAGVLMTTASRAAPTLTLVSAGFGYCEGVVQGTADTDTYWINRESGRVDARISDKEHFVGLGDSGHLTVQPLSAALRKSSVLTRSELGALVDAAVSLAGRRGQRLEIEWTLDVDGKLYLLQARPITAEVEIGGFPLVLDDANINESFSGPTSPLTFSFAQSIYEDVFTEMVDRIAPRGVSKRRSAMAAKRLLSYHMGRVYYNMRCWHEMLACLPFRQFTINAWEAGIGSEQQSQWSEPPSLGSLGQRARATLRLVSAIACRGRGARKALSFLDRKITAVARLRWPFLGLHEALHEIDSLRADMQEAWAVNMMNDLIAALWIEALQKVAARAGLKSDHDLNELLTRMNRHGDLASLRPVRAIEAITLEIDRVPELRDQLGGWGDVQAIWDAICSEERHGHIKDRIEEYVALYGMRGPFDLKLEVPQAAESPLGVLALVRDVLSSGVPSIAASRKSPSPLRISPLWKPLVNWMASRASDALGDREEFRLMRSRVFALARRAFLNMGEKLRDGGLIDERDDVFWLTFQELQGLLSGSYPVPPPRLIVKLRRDAGVVHQESSPPSVIETVQPLGGYSAKPPGADDDLESSKRIFQGIASSSGSATGESILVDCPQSSPETAGRIVVTTATDPGWVHILRRAGALVSEKGNLLSHSAIVGREMGIPTVVGVKNATKLFPTGMMLTVDGTHGTVTVERLADR